MFEKFKIIRELRKLRRVSANDRFLLLLRKRMGAEMRAFPAPKAVSVSAAQLIKTKAMPVVLTLAIIAAFGGGGVAMASQDSVPGELLYPVKTLTEEVRAAVAVGAKRQAELQAEFAAERVDEVKKLLEQNGVDPAGLDVALLRFEEHVNRAADAVEKEKAKGRDVSAVAKTIGEKFDDNKELLKTVVKAREKNLEKTKKELLIRAEEARQSAGAAGLGELTDLIDEIETERKTLELRRKTAEKAIELKKERIEKEIGGAEEARRAMIKAAVAKDEILQEAAEKGFVLPPAVFKNFETHISAAAAAFEAGRFQQAKQQSKAAEEALKHAEKIIDDEENGDDDARDEEIPESGIPGGKPADFKELPLPSHIHHEEENDVDEELEEIEEKLIELNKETRSAPLHLSDETRQFPPKTGALPTLH